MKSFQGKRNVNPDESFWSKVSIPNKDGCMIYNGAIGSNGYGIFWDGFKTISAHRYAWQSANSDIIPPGKFVLHKCDNRICCAPDHLYLGTHMENMQDAAARSNMGNEGRSRIKFYCGELWLIRKLASNGITYTKIAEMFKTKRWTISRIVKDINRPCKEII